MSEQEYRIEKCGGLTVYHPVKKQAEVISIRDWWAPHDSKDCNVFFAPHADCDCSADLAA